MLPERNGWNFPESKQFFCLSEDRYTVFVNLAPALAINKDLTAEDKATKEALEPIVGRMWMPFRRVQPCADNIALKGYLVLSPPDLAGVLHRESLPALHKFHRICSLHTRVGLRYEHVGVPRARTAPAPRPCRLSKLLCVMPWMFGWRAALSKLFSKRVQKFGQGLNAKALKSFSPAPQPS